MEGSCLVSHGFPEFPNAYPKAHLSGISSFLGYFSVNPRTFNLTASLILAFIIFFMLVQLKLISGKSLKFRIVALLNDDVIIILCFRNVGVIPVVTGSNSLLCTSGGITMR